MKKKSLLLAIAAMSMAAVGVGTVGTFAWYTANANATVNAASASGSLTTTASHIDAGNYTVNFTVTPADSELELSHVVTEAGTDGAGTAVAVGDLVYGVVSNGTVTTRKISEAGNFITSFSISASWATTPTETADVAYLGGKKFTINLGVTGQAKFLTANNAVSGQGNATAATAVVHIAANMGLTVDTISYSYIHIEPSNLSGSETGTTGAVTVTEATGVSLEADN